MASPSPAVPARRSPSAAACLAAVAFGLAACDAGTPIPPISPGGIQNTMVASGAGVVATFTGTPGPSPTPTPLATRVLALPPGESLRLDPGFGAGVFAEDLGPVAMMALAPNGDVLATVPQRNSVLVLPDRDHDGVADSVETFAAEEGLNLPYGIAIRPGWVYVANTDSVVRYPYSTGDLKAKAAPEKVVDLPADGAERARDLAFGRDGNLYVSVGASCNVCAETDPRRAAVLQFGPEGQDPKLWSAGLRGPLGLAFHPTTGELWGTELSREGLGDDRPPDELNRLAPGDYGWPNCYGKQVYDPELAAGSAVCAGTTAPAVTLPAHSGPSGAAFYPVGQTDSQSGAQFPAGYRGNLLVALHGSANRRSIPTGYSVVRLPYQNGQPTGEVFDFASGWLRPDTRRWGSPVDVEVAADGAVLVSDDGGGRIYRIYYAVPPTP